MPDSVLATHNLSKNFGALKACDAVSLELMGNEVHAIIGPNGAGKSTLLAQICGTLKPDAGSVFFLDNDVSDVSARVRARNGLARTFQVSALAMDDTVLQNALLGSLGASCKPWRFFKRALSDKALLAVAENALSRVGLANSAHRKAFELSHGERRQLEIAIALTLSPKVFIMDEPMAGLGSEGSKQLTELLHTLKKEAPILLVEHDMDAVFALADRISVLVYGKVIATGTVDEIRSDKLVQDAYLGADV